MMSNKDNFQKYRSITNSYQSQFIERILREFPQLELETYIIQEKLHGANIQLYFTPNELIKVGKRTGWVKEENREKFYDIKNTIKRYEEEDSLKDSDGEGGLCSITNYFQAISDKLNQEIRLYGELFGQGVQKGIDYGEEKQLLFYDIEIDGVLQSQDIFEKNVPGIWQVPIIAIVKGLQEALAFNIKFNSKILSVEDNICEGIVIKPYNKVYYNNAGKLFYLKKKNEKFLEKNSLPKIKVFDPVVEEWHNKFREYINKNRIESVFSKNGQINDIQEFGKYIKLVIEDAREEFLEETEFRKARLEKKQTKEIFNVGNIVAGMLKEYL